MSNRNDFSQNRSRNYSDPTPFRQNTKYHQRGGRNNFRPESNRRPINGDDVNSLTVSIGRHLTTDGNSSQESFLTRRSFNGTIDRRPPKKMYTPPIPQIGWWRITVQEAGKIGKQRVMEALQGRCTRPFQPYHYYIEVRNKAGVFFVNNQNDADMIKRLNGKVEVQNLDILRIVMCRIPAPVPSIDEDARPHFKDHLLNRRFNQHTFQLDLTNLADDEELSSLGIFPQLNKQAFIRDIVDIINKDLPMTRVIDLGSNNIVNLYEFRNLHLNNLFQISFASNRLKNVDDFDHLKQLPHLAHIYIKNNPLTLSNTKQANSINDIISTVQKKLPQLKRIDDIELPTIIRFGTDIETATLPKSLPHCVPAGEMQTFLTTFIELFFRLFDTQGREELHACYHDSCMFSLCISTMDNSFLPTRQFKYGSLIYESRNLKKVIDDNRRISLLRHGKIAVMDFLKGKFPLTKHDGNSFRVDVISTTDERAVFTVNGLYKEVDQGTNSPVRCFQRTFTCARTTAGVLIVADHILLTNPTETQFSNMKHSSAVTTTSSQPTNNQNDPTTTADIENQLVLRFSQQSGMNIEYSRLCLQENSWNYDRAAEVFLELRNKNGIPSAAYSQS